LFAIEKTGQVNHFTAENSGLNTNYLLSVSEDNSGEIWVGTEHTGISKISLTKYYNQVFFPNPEKTESADKTIRSIYENHSNGDLWIGTKSGEVYLFDENFSMKKSFSLREGVPYCITTDTSGNVWIGTKGNGILIIPENGNSLNKAHSLLLADDNNTGTNNIYSILCDRKGRMWIGSFGGGLFLCEHVNGISRIIPFPSVSGRQKQIRCMIEDSAGLIWAGGENGVVVFNPDSLIDNNEQFRWFHYDKSNPRSLNNNVVKAIFEDSCGRIWAGTGGGLNMAVKDSSAGNIEFKHYTSEDGLVNNMVQAILEDENQALWVSTESGISKFDVTSVIFENYNFPDSWESELFCESSAVRRKKGELLFGSHNGMYIFNPSSSENRTSVSPVMITGLSINGIPVGPDSPDSPLAGSITGTQNIRLENGQNSFSIEFSSLNFQNSHSGRYTYILENYDKEWNPVTQYNVATYKNIPAGEYVFKVKNYNNPGKRDSQEAQLGILVVPPFWKSTEAFILYIVLCVIITFFSVRLVVKMNKLHNEIEIEKQLTEFRLRFFTNISHEFRTPLTIIRGSIESINALDSLSLTLRKHVKTLDRSSSKLMRLINQLLEFRKMQNDRMELRLEHTDVVSFMRGIFDMFAETAERKRIQFTFLSDRESKMILLDREKMEKIVFNLLSNAFKHTPDDGNVALNIAFEAHDDLFVLSVSDSGIGIPPDKEHLLFVRFGQINYSSSGIGIGLHLTSEFTCLHKGKIKYEKSEWGGARFIVSIPASIDSYNPEDIVDSGDYPEISDVMDMSGIMESSGSIGPSDTIGSSVVADFAVADNVGKELEDPERVASTLKYKVLIIEDDEEIRLFLEDQLDKLFVIQTARDGLTGWDTAMREQPDLIVCDVMMPGMNGFEVTRKLKSDFQTSHIPIIMLTAHSSMEHQLEGINAGADAYIIKPFSTKYLISRIVKLIEQRERLQDKFAHEPSMAQTIICTSNKDNEFIGKVHSIIEEHLDDADFSVDDFSKAANMGRTIFYKKIKGITNFSPNEYLRIIRLKKATELLKATEFNISEIAYKVGFNDPFYFSKCFKEQFGMKPTQFRENEKNKGIV
jgi:signal transduction histidine kinase/DNA-binding response OmpR family regulator/streptogramin lyase